MPSQLPQDTALLTVLLRAETNVWEALKTGDASRDAAALDHAFLGVYPDGFANKSDHVWQLANGPTIASYSLHDARVLPLGDRVAVLSYRAVLTRDSNATSEVMYVSSIWVQQGNKWFKVFSQDTPAAV